MKTALVTGGLGFIGSNLSQELVKEGYKVSIISKSPDKIENIREIADEVDVKIQDVRDISKEDVEGKDLIFHCASTTHNYHIKDDPFVDVDINCNGTIYLLESCKDHNPSARIVFLSTFFVNGNLDTLPATPDSPCNPLGLYPATRLAGEHFCSIYNKVFGLDTVVARLTNVFGIHEKSDDKQKAAFNSIIRLAYENKEIPLYNNGDFIRDYIYVEDVVRALITIANNGKTGGTYYVGRGEKTRFGDLVDMVIDEAKGGKIVPVVPPEFHKQVGIKDYYCDPTPLRELGWKPQISLREGIKRVLKEYAEKYSRNI
ncbi:MAG: NAD-dependent epimerase/dehydratase family protein [Candidatus Pacearchaeota archaeon]|nr:NAD-dependent epimerase/dehydratase family protein [Candidatus Pacearchaeota archaeon]